MASLSTEPRLSRILIQAYYQHCFDDVLKIVSVLVNSQNLFIKGHYEVEREAHFLNKLSFLQKSGDFFTFLNVYNEWL